MIDALYNWGLNLVAAGWWASLAWPVIWNLVKIVCVLAPLMGAVAYLTLWERRLLGFMQVRLGPNRVGPFGLLQPIADAFKLLTKEIIQPTAAAKGLFVLGPIMAIMPALAAWVAIPFAPDVALANVNVGLLLIMAITSIEVYGVIIAGWASNSKYAFLGALRASAQMVSYEIAMGFCFLVVLMVSGSMNMTHIVLGQGGQTIKAIGQEKDRSIPGMFGVALNADGTVTCEAVALTGDPRRREELDQAAPEIKSNLEVFAGDVRDPNGIREAMRGCDKVLHLAALIAIPYSYAAPDSYVDTNIRGPHIAEAIQYRRGIAT